MGENFVTGLKNSIISGIEEVKLFGKVMRN